MRVQRVFLDLRCNFFRQFRRAKILCFALGIFIGVIVKAIERTNLDDGQNLIAQYSNRQFAALDELLDENGRIKFQGVSDSRGEFFPRRSRARTNARSLAVGLDEHWQGHRDFLKLPHQLATGSRHAILPKPFLRLFLVDGDATGIGIRTGKGNATRIQDVLHLAIFAKSSV